MPKVAYITGFCFVEQNPFRDQNLPSLNNFETAFHGEDYNEFT